MITDLEKHTAFDIDHTKSILFSAKKIKPTASLTEHLYGVSCLTVDKKHSILYSASFDDTINYYDCSTAKFSGKLTGHTDGIWCLDIDTNKGIVASAGTDREIILWDSNSKNITNKLKYHDQTVYGLKFANTKHDQLLSCSKGKIVLWDLKKTKEPLSVFINESNRFVYSANFVSNDNFVVSGVIDGDLEIYSVNTKEVVARASIKFSNYKSEINLDPDNGVRLNIKFLDIFN